MTKLKHPEIWLADWSFFTKGGMITVKDMVTPKIPQSELKNKKELVLKMSKSINREELLIDRETGIPTFQVTFKKFLGDVNYDTEEPITDFTGMD